MKLAVTLTADRQQAILHLPANVSLSIEEVRGMIRDAGVVYGILKDAVMLALHAEENDRQLIIAKGRPVRNARAGRLRPAIADHDLPKRFAAGAVLGEYQPAVEPEDGMGVNGAELRATRIERLYGLNHGLSYDEETKQLTAEADGWFFLDADGNYCLDIHGCPLHMEQVEVTIAANRSKASVDVPAGCFVPLVVMKSLVANHAIKHGLDVDQMRAAAKVADQDRILVVARATPAQDGGDSRLSHAIAEHPAFEPDEHGDIDFRDWNSIVQVAEGQVLADLSKASDGIDGCDVLGQPIPAKPGESLPIDRFLGEGTVSGPEGKQVLAARDGIYQRGKDGKVHVVALMVVDGDVDLHSGSIETDYAVVIKGDIKDGFKVKSGSDIEVYGVIEDARVTAQGNLEVKGGILPGKNRVKAHGDISCSFARERELKCSNLIARESLTNCRILATAAVHAKEIGGGELRSNGDLTCETLGSRIEAETLVHVGIDPYLRSQLDEQRQNKAALEEKIGKAKERAKLTQAHLDRLARKYLMSPKPEIKAEIDSVASEARRALREYKGMVDGIDVCTKEIADLEERLHLRFEDVHVRASKQVYPGVTVRIGPTYYNTVFEALTNADFHA